MSDAINNKRIAKNTMFLYVRMIVLMIINLYTSRVVLDALGVVDFGIYNVVGGFVTMFSIINAAMTTATQRFLSFELGKGNKKRVQSIFSTTVYIHIFLSILILVLAETIGLWFLNTKMQFPEDRIFAANVVFQMSVFALILKVISLPYNAALIAYERMSAFAYVGIVEAILGLAIVFVLYVSSQDKLIVYATLVAIVSAFIQIIYWTYCRRNFSETCKVRLYCKEDGKMLMSFVGWNLIGSSAAITQDQGINVLLNMFFDATVNSAKGLSSQVKTALARLVSNFTLAMNPQIVKSYAAGEIEAMNNLVIKGCRFSYLLTMIVSIPLYVKAEFVLGLWLVEVPAYTVLFVRITILMELVESMKHTLVTAVLATGNVKYYQLTNGVLMLMIIPVAFLCLKLGCSAESALYAALSITILCHLIRGIMVRRLINSFPISLFIFGITVKLFAITVFSWYVSKVIADLMTDNIINNIIGLFITFLVTCTVGFVMGIDKSEKRIIINKVKEILNNKRI